MKCPVCNHENDHTPGTGRCWVNLGVGQICSALALAIIGRFMPYYEAVTGRHNGYDPAVPGVEEPETPKQAIQELLDEERQLAEIEMRMKIAEALAHMEQGRHCCGQFILWEALEDG